MDIPDDLMGLERMVEPVSQPERLYVQVDARSANWIIRRRFLAEKPRPYASARFSPRSSISLWP